MIMPEVRQMSEREMLIRLIISRIEKMEVGKLRRIALICM